MKADGRASWCALPYAHDAHGPNSKEPCPGWAGNPPHSNGERMPHGITRVLVESVVQSLNDKAERLGWIRRYQFVKGNHNTGIQHSLETIVPHLVHPLQRQPIGNTLSKAYQYLAAMGQVMNDALSERERERAVVRGGVLALDPGRTTGFAYDPDARQHRADQADYLSRPAGADQ